MCVALVLLFFSGTTVNVIAYLLATLVTVGSVTAFRAIDSQRRSEPAYALSQLAQNLNPAMLSWLLLVVGVIVGAVHAWRIADVVARW